MHLVHQTKSKEKNVRWWSRSDICPLIGRPRTSANFCHAPCPFWAKLPWCVPAPVFLTLSTLSPRAAKFLLATNNRKTLILESSYPQICPQFSISPKPWSNDRLLACVQTSSLAKLMWTGLCLWDPPDTLWWLFLFFISDFQSKLFKIHLPIYAINSFIPDTFPEDGSMQCPFSRRPCSLSNFGHNTNCTD